MLRCVLGQLASDTSPATSGRDDRLSHLLAGIGLLPVLAEAAAKEPSTLTGDPSATNSDNGPADLTRKVLEWIYRFDGPGSIPDLMGRIRQNAAAVRDRFSGDTWQILDRLVPQPDVPTTRRSIAHALGLVQGLILNLAAFNGLAMENMTRGPGWRFLDVGRRLERGFSMTTPNDGRRLRSGITDAAARGDPGHRRQRHDSSPALLRQRSLARCDRGIGARRVEPAGPSFPDVCF